MMRDGEIMKFFGDRRRRGLEMVRLRSILRQGRTRMRDSEVMMYFRDRGG
jgi:hypothetical protein